MTRRLVVQFLLASLAAFAAAEPLTNDSIIKLAKAGMSETFILDIINQQPPAFSTEASRLSDLKQAGVSENVINAMIRKSPPAETLTSEGVVVLVRAGFSENFILDEIQRSKAKFSTDAGRIVEMKEAGVPERVLAAMVDQSATVEIPEGTVIAVRMIEKIDSRSAKQGDRFRASLSEPINVGNNVVAPRNSDAVVQLVEEKESGRLTGTTVLTVELVSVTINGKQVSFATDSYSKTSSSRTNSTVKRTAVLGGLGAVIGAIAGGGKGAAIGAGAGAGAGVGSEVLTKGQRINIPSEALLTFRSRNSVKI